MAETKLPMSPAALYFKLLYEAYDASRVCDDFDLHEDDPELVAQWNLLKAEQLYAQEKLIDWVVNAAGYIQRELRELSKATTV